MALVIRPLCKFTAQRFTIIRPETTLFGMVWVLEGTSVSTGGAMASLLQTHLQLPDDAMRYLKSHSELDQEHIQFFASLMNRITDPADQAVIIESAIMVFKLYGDMLRELTLTHANF